MKKLLFTILSLFALVLAGCEKEEPVQTTSSYDTLTATIESAANTKAELKPGTGADDAVSVVWKSGDCISVFFKIGSTVENVKYNLSTGENTTTGTFKKSGTTDLTGAQFIAAVYPYTQGAAYDESSKTVSGLVMPSSYEYSAEMHTTTAPMAYIGSVNSISFKNAAALVRVATTNVPNGYNSVELSSATSKLAGNYTITFNSSNEPVAALTNESTNGSTVTFINTSANQTFFFPILPGTYTDLTVSAKGTNTVPVELVASKALTAERNNFYYTDVTCINSADDLKNIIIAGGECKLTSDIDLALTTGSFLTIESGKTVAIDLNGFTLTTSNTSVEGSCPDDITVNGELTITNGTVSTANTAIFAVGGKVSLNKCAINSSRTGSSTISVKENSTLTIENCTANVAGTAFRARGCSSMTLTDCTASTTTESAVVSIEGANSTLTLNGGTYTGVQVATHDRYVIAVKSGASATINTTVSGGNGGVTVLGSTATLTGGSYTGVKACGLYVGECSTVTYSNCTFSGAEGNVVALNGTVNGTTYSAYTKIQ